MVSKMQRCHRAGESCVRVATTNPELAFQLVPQFPIYQINNWASQATAQAKLAIIVSIG